MLKTRVIAFANQKGGVGKTTTCVNVAAAFAMQGCRVLLVDSDPQGNATMGCGIDKTQLKHTLNELLLAQVKIQEVLVRDTPAGFDVLPSNSDLTQAEVGLLQVANKERQLAEALEKIEAHYDFIFIDCPPSLNMLTLNAMVAANSVVIPMQCEYYALEGLSGLLQTIEQLRETLNPGLHLEGIVRTMFDGRNRLAVEVSEQLLEHFPNSVYETTIPRNVRVAEAPSHGLPILQYDKSSKGAQAYLDLAKEMLKAENVSICEEAFSPTAEAECVLEED